MGRDLVKKKEYQRKWYLANQQRCRDVAAAWKRKNPDRVRATKRGWAKANPDKRLDGQLRVKYGITLAQRDEMLASQGGRCSTCPATTPGTKKGWHVDHCHTTGKIRGILCHHCNAALGLAQDNPARLRSLAAYVESHQ